MFGVLGLSFGFGQLLNVVLRSLGLRALTTAILSRATLDAQGNRVPSSHVALRPGYAVLRCHYAHERMRAHYVGFLS